MLGLPVPSSSDVQTVLGRMGVKVRCIGVDLHCLDFVLGIELQEYDIFMVERFTLMFDQSFFPSHDPR